MGRDFLKEIVEYKKEEIAKAKRKVSAHQLREKAAEHSQKRSFINKLKTPGQSGVNIIAEIKRASPSKGEIRIDLDAAHFAGNYETGGAAAISVLTEDKYFKGSFDDLKSAREFTTLPVLRKDFIISSYQLLETSAIGADAALLIVRILSEEQLKEYLSLCKELDLDALVEINSEEELEIATLAGATLIGINNRNLKTFKTDIETAMRLKSNLEPGQIAVAASGINNRGDIEKNLNFGIFNFLIGESVVRSEDTIGFLKSLIGR